MTKESVGLHLRVDISHQGASHHKRFHPKILNGIE